jgi:hypothetical protein
MLVNRILGVNAGFERQPLIVQILWSWSWFYAINAQSSFGEGAGAVASGAKFKFLWFLLGIVQQMLIVQISLMLVPNNQIPLVKMLL